MVEKINTPEFRESLYQILISRMYVKVEFSKIDNLNIVVEHPSSYIILVNGRLYLELSRELFEEAFINIRDNKINSIIK